MPRIDPEGQLTRAERLVVVIALVAAVAVHLAVLFGWGRLARWAEEVEKKERLVVIRRVRDLAPLSEVLPEPPRLREVQSRAAGVSEQSAPPPPPPAKQQVKEEGEPPPEPELSRKMEEELSRAPDETAPTPGEGESTVSVVTDLRQASFTVSGPAEFRGSGTLWLRKGAPPGAYTATFHPVAGFATPAIQSKELAPNGQIVFVGKYKRSLEVVVTSNRAEATVTVYRPDGSPLPIRGVGRILVEDPQPGTYTAVFGEIAGYVTPAPVTQTLAAGAGTLAFRGEYGGGGPAVSAGGGAPGPGSARSTSARRVPAGARAPRKRSDGAAEKEAPPAAPLVDAGYDRRVMIVVTSYPQTDIEEDFEPIAYPEVIIQRSDFQRGWCQVYLIVHVDDRGQVRGVAVERPDASQRDRYGALIAAVERAVRSWEYDTVRAEVHVDARFYVE